jgi:hypothetical protein
MHQLKVNFKTDKKAILTVGDESIASLNSLKRFSNFRLQDSLHI